ncbi:hypothetical protein HanRHA438_Chr02g0084781 [Helianthus annuus]|nr:hypothetical protein HanIR_Chr02g0085891 [Helianthus annuus]KAJ0940559.1 hypothetical protein HanRHA438_Chr02g0084781 [Helianthus annuus]
MTMMWTLQSRKHVISSWIYCAIIIRVERKLIILIIIIIIIILASIKRTPT